jgi:DNA polymerase-2
MLREKSRVNHIYRGFLVHPWADMFRRSPEGDLAGPGAGRLYFVGRLEDGRTFAAVLPPAKTCLGFHVRESDLPRCKTLLSGLSFSPCPPFLEFFDLREGLVFLQFSHLADRSAAYKILARGAVQSPDGGEKPVESFLMERQIRGWMEITGEPRPGKLVDLVFLNPELSPWSPPVSFLPPLRVASIDIETDTRQGTSLAAAVSWAESGDLNREFKGGKARGQARVLGGGSVGERAAGGGIIFHPDEASLLRALVEDIRGIDPDVLSGWNFLDFDFPRIAERCARHRIPLLLGRSREEAKFFAGEPGWGWRRRSAAALVPGRQVLDALRVVRAGGQGILTGMDEGGYYGSYSLESVSRRVLGEGKLVASSGEDKIAELEALYARNPGEFGAYCYRDSELVLRILAATGFFRLTLERACLTGVSLDKAWTSVASFERIYRMELRRKGIAPPPDDPRRQVSGAAGGTVLEPQPGFFNNIAVFDFRSLYPTVMLTFNIDPLAHARLEPGAAPFADPGAAPAAGGGPILAPNGAAFSRLPGLLPGLIAGYFAARREAIDRGDDIAAQVYKILMNSFYGVLGTASCRYGRTELAGAITSFARKWLLASRDWFKARGRRVIYGDTDSLFVESGLDDRAAYGDFSGLCGDLARELNRYLAERIREEYGLESFIELRFEKAYRRFFIPTLRNIFAGEASPEEASGEGAEDPAPLHAGVLRGRGTVRGRAKGYGGYLIHPGGGKETVEVKGMEAVRSDSTPLARRVQLELLELVFSGAGEAEFRLRVEKSLEELRAGKLDGELVYRKRLSRPPEEYTASTPPQVKAARALGWKGRRGTVEYVWTLTGAEPASLPHGPLDYGHYASTQLLPVAKSIADGAGWNMEDFFRKIPDHKPDPAGRQMEFGF